LIEGGGELPQEAASTRGGNAHLSHRDWPGRRVKWRTPAGKYRSQTDILGVMEPSW
jgi:hypothetical protein